MKTVMYAMCPCGKRGFETAHMADKALGRAQAKRRRSMEKAGTPRGQKMESRYYECRGGLYHLTSQSRREFQAAQTAPEWDMSQFRIGAPA